MAKRKRKRNPVPKPYDQWITPFAWRKLRKEDRMIIVDLVKFQNYMWKKYPNGIGSGEEYINMNAEIEYLKSTGEH